MHPISDLQGAILGLLQGVSELFPISSLGHSVILPRLLGWDIHQNDDSFVTFLVATHFATAIVLFLFFLRDWQRIFAGLLRSLREREISAENPDGKLGWLLIVGTVPAGLLGLALEHPLRSAFASAQSAAFFLMLNGAVLYGAERLRNRAPAEGGDGGPADTVIARRLGFGAVLGIGTAQALALIPGFSRSGASMGGGLLAGLSNENAARFSFLLATPIIGAAALLKLPNLFGAAGDGVRGPALIGAGCAALTAYITVRFLVRFFESNRLTPFAVYCAAAGAVLSIVFLTT